MRLVYIEFTLLTLEDQQIIVSYFPSSDTKYTCISPSKTREKTKGNNSEVCVITCSKTGFYHRHDTNRQG